MVRIPFPQEDGSLTPYSFRVGYQLVMLIYDSLLWRDRNGAAQPWLAQSVEVSPDGRRVTTRLRPGIRWQDGRPLTSADVAFTVRHVAAHPSPRFTPEVWHVAGVTTPDALTAVFALSQPSPSFLDQTLADLPILPEHLWRSLPPGRTEPDGLPVGSGPYRLTAHVAGQSYRFDANPDYFRGPPTVTTIVMPIIGDAEAMLAAFEAHQLDMIPVGLPENDRARVDQLGTRVVTGSDYLGGVLMINTRRVPFDHSEVRRAVSEAIDPANIAQILGNAIAATGGYVHPDSPWALPHDPHALDSEGAARVLRPLRLPPVEILTPDNDGVKEAAAREVAASLQRAGVDARVATTTRSGLSHAVGEDGSVPSFTMALWNTFPQASFDPDFLGRVFGSDPPALFGYTGYHSPAFDAAAARVATTTDLDRRRAAIADELRVLAADAPVVPLYYPVGSFVYRPAAYDGWVFVKGAGLLDKQSFEATAVMVTPGAPARSRPGDDHPGGGALLVGLPALPVVLGSAGLLVLAALGLLVEAIRRRAR